MLDADGRFGSVEVWRYDCNEMYDASEYPQLMLSYSVMQLIDESDRRGRLDDIEAFIRTDFGGNVTRPLVVALTTTVLR